MGLTKKQRKMLEQDVKKMQKEKLFTLKFGIALIVVGLLLLLTGIQIFGTLSFLMFLFGALAIFDVQKLDRDIKKVHFLLAGS